MGILTSIKKAIVPKMKQCDQCHKMGYNVTDGRYGTTHATKWELCYDCRSENTKKPCDRCGTKCHSWKLTNGKCSNCL